MSKRILGEMIAKYRKEARMTQEELGKLVNVSTQAVSRWECGGTPDVELLPMISDSLHVSIDALFGRDGGTALDVKELVCQKIKHAPKDKCMDILMELIWAMQQAAQLNARPDLASAFEMFPFDAIDRSNEESPNLIPAHMMLCDDRSIMLHGMVTDRRFAAIIPEPDGGFESTLKHTDQYIRLFTLLAKPHYLDMLVDINRRKPGENFTPRSAASRLGIAEEEAKAILKELYHHMLLECIEVEDEHGTLEVYHLSAYTSLYVFLFFCDSVMYSAGSMQANANLREKPIFRAVPGTGSLTPDWDTREAGNNGVSI